MTTSRRWRRGERPWLPLQAAVVTAAEGAGPGTPVGGWPFSTTPHCLDLPLRTQARAPQKHPAPTCPLSNGELCFRLAVHHCEGKEPCGRPELHLPGRLGDLRAGALGGCGRSIPSCPVRTRTPGALCRRPVTASSLFCTHSKTTQRNKQIAMGRKKFNMDPKKVSSRHEHGCPCYLQISTP